MVDDIWNWREWEMIMNSLPENNMGSRIVGITRIKAVAEKWCKHFHGPNGLLHGMLPNWFSRIGWIYGIGEINVARMMISMKADLVAEGFNLKHPVVLMCGGMPLAVRCMLLAVTHEQEKQAQQGLSAKPCDLQDDIKKHVMENGIQNTPGFEALVESLQLGFDDLPHHMLKTCLLYCSMYPVGHEFESEDLVRRWVSEGFVYKEDESNSYFQELFNRGFLMRTSASSGKMRMHPMMHNFLGWKSHQDNFIVWSSEITPCRIRRLCIYNSPCRDNAANQADPLSALDWNHVRSLVVYEGIERVPFEKLEGVRLLDLRGARDLPGRHWKDICGLVRLRHLLGFNGNGHSDTAPEIVRMQCLETFEASGSGFARLHGFIGNLQQLKTLDVRGHGIKQLTREIGVLQQLRTLNITYTLIEELPREIQSLQQLETLDMHSSSIKELPKEAWSLQQLKTLDITRTRITQLPKEIGKLQHLEHLLMSGTKVAKVPRKVGGLKKLKNLKLDRSIAALPLEVCQVVSGGILEFPECIRQALKKTDVLSELAREMLFFQLSGGLVVGTKQMHVPPWIKEHFNDLQELDIRICKLEDGGLKILQEMAYLRELTLRFVVVPREAVVISSQGFPMLRRLTVDSRVPRVTFQEGAMPQLQWLKFLFQFYGGLPNKGPMGINHLRSLTKIEFTCNEDWYRGGDSPCIHPTIDVVTKEARSIDRNILGR
jgi:Leucine-rich repeat (LRR) protein